MKKQIWKFPIVAENPAISMPIGAEILTIQTQSEQPCIWALVDPDAEKESRLFDVIGTGHTFDILKEHKYINTFQLQGGAFVFHVFEYKPD